MGTKLTNYTTTFSVQNAAKILITQDVDGTEHIRRATIEAIVSALRANGINSGYAATEDLEAYVANVEEIEGGIRVTYGDGQHTDVEIGGGLAFDEITFEDGYLHILAEGEDVVEPCYIGGGGGGGGDTGSVVRIVNGMSSRSFTILSTVTDCNIAYSWTSLDSETEDPTGNGTASWFVNNTRVAVESNIAQGSRTFNIRNFLTDGTANTVKLTIEDSYGTTKSFSWTVTVSNLSMSWNLDNLGYHGDNSLTVRMTPNGVGEKTIYVTLDGTQVYTTTTSATGRAISTTIAAQSHGAHVIEAWMSVVIDGETVTTAKLRHCGIWTQSGYGAAVIAVENTALTTQHFSTLPIRYMIYKTGSDTVTATLAVDGTTVSTITADRTVQTWSYRPTTTGEKTLTITVGNTTATITVTVTSIGYDISEVPGAIITLDPTGHTNTEQGYDTFGYTDGGGTKHPLTFSSNFDWIHGGFQQDSEGVTALVIKRGTYVEFDRSLFSDNIRSTGKEIKMIFKATNVRDYSTTIADGVAGGVGIQLNAQSAVIKSSNKTLEMPYCEDAKIELDVNINAVNDDRLAFIWLKGIPSRVYAFANDENWQQDVPANFRIGSDEADVWIYKIKMYGTSLTRFEIFDNYVADCANVEEMIARYERNQVYGDGGDINIQKLADANPNLRVIHITADRMTTSKEDPVTCTVQHILRGASEGHTFTATGATMKAQGTSSLDYAAAALNLDIDFDGSDWEDSAGNEMSSYAMTSNSIPVKYFNIKLNVASSENANNVLFADDYNTYQPFLTPARIENAKVRDTVEGHPCAVFFTNSSESTIQVSSHTVGPGETIFYGAGDMNNSKKNTAVFGQSNETYNNLCCIEIINNNSPQCLFQSDDLTSEDWTGKNGSCFEPRFPKTLTASMISAFQAMLTWVVSTDPTAATGDLLDAPVTYDEVEYTADTVDFRKAKFRAEVGDYFSVDSLTYHYLFTERHCMVDNRAKNTFISYEWDTDKSGYRWNFTKDYDNDTADGNDNSGGLTFTYGLEDTDSIAGAKVFNAYDSVLWCNVRDCLGPELEAMYKDRESAGAWSASRIIGTFIAYQGARPESVYIEDAWNKYIAPYLANGETRYLDMMYGTKEDQRRQFETYQERYMATKYGGALATSDSVEFRASSQIDGTPVITPSGNMQIKPYSDMYITVKYGNAGTVKVRAKRGVLTTIICPTNNLVDTETYVYLASNITELKGLAGLYTRVATLSSATRLQVLELGSATSGYHNDRLTTISFGNNPLLEYIDLRGTPNLAQALDLSGLTSLEEVYLTGSGVTGVTFAVGAPVKKAWIPAVVNLTARGLTQLTEWRIVATALQRLWIDNSEIDTLDLVEDATALQRGRIIGVDWELENPDILIRLSRLGGIDESGENVSTFVLTGSASIEEASQAELDLIDVKFPNLTVTYDTIVPAYTVTFEDEDGTVLNEQIVREGGTALNPITAGLIPTPTKASDVDYNYTFMGWDTSFSNITADTTITATYGSSTRTYTVRWYNGIDLLQEVTVDARDPATYTGSDPVATAPAFWGGWDASTLSVVSDLDVHAVFITPVMPESVASNYDYIYSDDPTDNSGYTFAEMIGIINAGKGKEYFTAGDKIKMFPDSSAFTDTVIVFRLAAFYHFKITGTSDFAHCVFHMIGVMNATHNMNTQNTNIDGWSGSGMRTFLNGTIFPALPQKWKAVIKSVDVISTVGGQSSNLITSSDKLWLPSYSEMGYGTGNPYGNEIDADAESKAFPVYTNDYSRVHKKNNGMGDASIYWLRSPGTNGSYNFWSVTVSGSSNDIYALYAYGVAFGFCI